MDEENVMDFLGYIGKLKGNLRYGGQQGLADSVAEHSYRAAVMVTVLAAYAGPKVDIQRATQMVLFHNIGQCEIGNTDKREVCTSDGSGATDRFMHELAAQSTLIDMLPRDLRSDIEGVVKEWLGDSGTARFAKAVTALETMLHITERGYKHIDKPDLVVQYAVPDVVEFPALIPVYNAILDKLKIEFEKGDIEWKPEYRKLSVE